jgi:hypothetical protein
MGEGIDDVGEATPADNPLGSGGATIIANLDLVFSDYTVTFLGAFSKVLPSAFIRLILKP